MERNTYLNRIFRQNKLVDLVSLVYSILYAIDIIAKRWSDMGDGIRERKMRNRKWKNIGIEFIGDL